jgi:hypothetical protein
MTRVLPALATIAAVLLIWCPPARSAAWGLVRLVATAVGAISRLGARARYRTPIGPSRTTRSRTTRSRTTWWQTTWWQTARPGTARRPGPTGTVPSRELPLTHRWRVTMFVAQRGRTTPLATAVIGGPLVAAVEVERELLARWVGVHGWPAEGRLCCRAEPLPVPGHRVNVTRPRRPERVPT